MRVIQRFNQSDIIEACERFIHHFAHIGVEVDGENHRHIIARRNLANSAGNALHPLAKVLAAMAGHADNALASKACFKLG